MTPQEVTVSFPPEQVIFGVPEAEEVCVEAEA